jgi:hypothetical protein
LIIIVHGLPNFFLVMSGALVLYLCQDEYLNSLKPTPWRVTSLFR